jgi:DNA-binding transcriptional ArsR family regulator
MPTPQVGLLTGADHVAIALHPLRRRILAKLSSPDSATGVARQLGEPRQKINHHLRALEAAGLVVLVEERARRGLTERLFARSHDELLVDPEVLTRDAQPASIAEKTQTLDRTSRHGLGSVVALAVSVLRHAAEVAEDAVGQPGRVPTATIDAEVRIPSPEAAQRFLADLTDLLAQHDRPAPGAMRLRFSATLLPHIAKPTSDGAAPSIR